MQSNFLLQNISNKSVLHSLCFHNNYFLSRFNSQDSDGVVIDENRASCIMPTFTEAEGWVDFEVSLNGEAYYWKGMFYVGKLKKHICTIKKGTMGGTNLHQKRCRNLF